MIRASGSRSPSARRISPTSPTSDASETIPFGQRRSCSSDLRTTRGAASSSNNSVSNAFGVRCSSRPSRRSCRRASSTTNERNRRIPPALLRVFLAFSMLFLGTPIVTPGNLSRSHALMAFQEYVYSPVLARNQESFRNKGKPNEELPTIHVASHADCRFGASVDLRRRAAGRAALRGVVCCVVHEHTQHSGRELLRGNGPAFRDRS